MRFRPCIDIHNGSVKQIVGGSLTDENNMAIDNFVSEKDAKFYAELYRKDGLCGGHIILLNPVGSEFYEKDVWQAKEALAAFSHGLQLGGGITAENAVFNNCDFTHATAEESEFVNCKFINCKMNNSMFTHSALPNCTFKGCEFFRASFRSTMLKDTQILTSDGNTQTFNLPDTEGASYDLDEWCSENEGVIQE